MESKFSEMISFETSLYENRVLNDISNIDTGFIVDRIVQFPSFRPLFFATAVEVCKKFRNNSEFMRSLLESSVKLCPILTYNLYKSGIFRYEEIEKYINQMDLYILCYCFRKEISDFNDFIQKKRRPYYFDDSFFENESIISMSIEYGFPPSTIEYCLKYDDIEVFRSLLPSDQTECKWSPFEWSRKPENLDFLSFSGFFGSISCFKHLLMSGYCPNSLSKSLVSCCGNLDLYHLCNDGGDIDVTQVFSAASSCQLSLLTYMFENGADIRSISCSKETLLHSAVREGHISIVDFLLKKGANINARGIFIYITRLITLPFIWLLKKDTIKLLNTWLLMELTLTYVVLLFIIF